MEENDRIERVLQVTADGSHTLFLPQLNEHYHSVNGAIQESRHIFIHAGLNQIEKKDIQLLEIGFGTGLNALLTLAELMRNDLSQHLVYHSVERYPLDINIVEKLNYGRLLGEEEQDLFIRLHRAAWGEEVQITSDFTLHKIKGDSNCCELPNGIDLIYFDAFAPDKQPEMWNQTIFDKLFAVANPGALILTYCAKGIVRRSMQSAGFVMEKLPGPPGKRHILRGTKPKE